MKVLFDVCVVIDILGKTSFFKDAFSAYDVALFKKMDVCLSASSTTDIAYVLASRGLTSRESARNLALNLSELFDIVDVTKSDVRMASESVMKDYEDALIAYAALRSGVDFIITRNAKDFEHSPVPAMTPNSFVSLYKPTCLEYEEVAF